MIGNGENGVFTLIDREIQSLEDLLLSWKDTEIGKSFESEIKYWKSCKTIISSSLDLDDLRYREENLK